MTDRLIDPDCRDRKHSSCVGGPCECPCHLPVEEQLAALQPPQPCGHLDHHDCRAKLGCPCAGRPDGDPVLLPQLPDEATQAAHIEADHDALRRVWQVITRYEQVASYGSDAISRAISVVVRDIKEAVIGDHP